MSPAVVLTFTFRAKGSTKRVLRHFRRMLTRSSLLGRLNASNLTTPSFSSKGSTGKKHGCLDSGASSPLRAMTGTMSLISCPARQAQHIGCYADLVHDERLVGSILEHEIDLVAVVRVLSQIHLRTIAYEAVVDQEDT
jgi:hypothetical protein